MPRLDFDATRFAPAPFDGPGPLPPGKYLATVVSSDLRRTKAGTGHYLELEFEVSEGEHRGRRLWSRLNVDHPNETAVRIAKEELASVCRAVGIARLSDTEALHGKPLLLSVRASTRRDSGEATTEIRGYAPPPRGAAPASPQQSSPSPAPATPPKGTYPWNR